MNKRNFLFARPSFLKGAGSVLNIGATGRAYYNSAKFVDVTNLKTIRFYHNSAKSVARADLKALESDWKIIGDDMREALDEYKTQTSARAKG